MAGSGLPQPAAGGSAAAATGQLHYLINEREPHLGKVSKGEALVCCLK